MTSTTRDPRLTPSEKAVLNAVFAEASVSKVTLAEIRAYVGLGERTIWKALHALRELRVLDWVSHGSRNFYKLLPMENWDLAARAPRMRSAQKVRDAELLAEEILRDT